MGTLWLGGEVGLGLHTLQGLRASARGKVPGVGRRIFFRPSKEKQKKIPRRPSTLFSEKSVQSVQALQYPVYHPLSSASYTPHQPPYRVHARPSYPRFSYFSTIQNTSY